MRLPVGAGEAGVLEGFDEGRGAAGDELVFGASERAREVHELIEQWRAGRTTFGRRRCAHVAFVGVPATQRGAGGSRDLRDARAILERDAAAAHARVEVDEHAEVSLAQLARVRRILAQDREAVARETRGEFRERREVRAAMRIGDEQVDRRLARFRDLEQHTRLAHGRALEVPQACGEQQFEHLRHLRRLHVRPPAREASVRREQLRHARHIRAHTIEAHEQQRRRQVLERAQVLHLASARRRRFRLESGAILAGRRADLEARQAHREQLERAAAVRMLRLVRDPVVDATLAGRRGSRRAVGHDGR